VKTEGGAISESSCCSNDPLQALPCLIIKEAAEARAGPEPETHIITVATDHIYVDIIGADVDAPTVEEVIKRNLSLLKVRIMQWDNLCYGIGGYRFLGAVEPVAVRWSAARHVVPWESESIAPGMRPWRHDRPPSLGPLQENGYTDEQLQYGLYVTPNALSDSAKRRLQNRQLRVRTNLSRDCSVHAPLCLAPWRQHLDIALFAKAAPSDAGGAKEGPLVRAGI